MYRFRFRRREEGDGVAISFGTKEVEALRLA